jgi:hypothetical protein
MELRVYDTGFNLLGAVDMFESFILHRKLFTPGVIEMQINPAAHHFERLGVGKILMVAGHPEKAGVIRSMDIAENGSVKFSGQTLEGFLSQRIVAPAAGADYDRVNNVSVEEVLRYYVNGHAAAPTDSKRVIPNLALAPNQKRGGGGKWQAAWKPLTEVLENIGVFYRMGYHVTFDPVNKRFVFDVIPQRQTLVVFSREFDNIYSRRYTKSYDKYASTAYAKGPTDTMITSVGTSYGGLDRYETYLSINDAADIPDLAELATVELAEYAITETVSAEVVPGGSFEYERDYQLGDLVTIRDLGFGFMVNIQITEVVESWDSAGHKITPLFGDQELTIGRYLKKLQQEGKA